MEFPEHPFWDFALRVYGSEGVSAACLELQERHGIDVNVLLFCLWLGESGRGVLEVKELKEALAAAEDWNGRVVKGLRAVRRALKDGFARAPAALRDGLRAGIQAVEIDAEHLEQLMIAAAVERRATRAEAPRDARAEDAARNAGRYLADKGITLEPRDAVNFAHILGRTFPGLGPERALDLAERLM
ncbi:MAG TPA: TIGR02444 family protein [Alphaproteobacteria bacterium]|jgi:uncharacterized protein (TIGR02444 family)